MRIEVLEPWGMAKLAVPAVLYLLQNNLYFALSHLRAATRPTIEDTHGRSAPPCSASALGCANGRRSWP